MTRPGIEARSPGPLANTLTARPMSGLGTLPYSLSLILCLSGGFHFQYPRVPVPFFLPCDSIISTLGSSIFSVVSLLPLFIITTTRFSTLISIPGCIFLLFVSKSPLLFHFLRLLSCCIYIKWSTFSFDFVNLLLTEHFLCMWLSGIISNTNDIDEYYYFFYSFESSSYQR